MALRAVGATAQNDNNDEIFLENMPITINKVSSDESKLINILENSDSNNNEKKNYSKMKVDDLKSDLDQIKSMLRSIVNG